MGQSQSEVVPQLKASASLAATTNVSAKLGRVERGALVTGGLFLLVVIGGLICQAVRPSPLNIGAVVVGLVGLVAVAVGWLYLAGTSNDPETPLTSVEVSTRDGHKVALQSQNVSHAQILQLLRHLTQPREPLPNPHGELRQGGNPNAIEDFRTYDAAESQGAGAELRGSVEKQEKEILESIRNLILARDGVTFAGPREGSGLGSDSAMRQADGTRPADHETRRRARPGAKTGGKVASADDVNLTV